MSWSYSGDPSKSELDAFRFMLKDTVETDPLLQDEEIQYILANYKGKNARLAIGYRQCAATLARKPIKRSLGPQSEDNSKRLQFYENMADQYEDMLVFSGRPRDPQYQHDVVFEKGMMEAEKNV
jgi:hypothetical protein